MTKKTDGFSYDYSYRMSQFETLHSLFFIHFIPSYFRGGYVLVACCCVWWCVYLCVCVVSEGVCVCVF